MKLPNSITIQVLKNSKKANGLICSVQLLTHKKNNFSLGIYKTDNEGWFIITKEIIELKIKEAVEFFEMDYDNSAKNMMNKIEVTIENNEDLKKRISRIKEFFPEKMDEIKPIVINNKNDIIISSFKKTLPIKESIEINI